MYLVEYRINGYYFRAVFPDLVTVEKLAENPAVKMLSRSYTENPLKAVEFQMSGNW